MKVMILNKILLLLTALFSFTFCLQLKHDFFRALTCNGTGEYYLCTNAANRYIGKILRNTDSLTFLNPDNSVIEKCEQTSDNEGKCEGKDGGIVHYQGNYMFDNDFLEFIDSAQKPIG